MADQVTRNDVETRLREAELRLTPQRFAVLEYLTRAGGHPTADQIAAELNRRFPGLLDAVLAANQKDGARALL